MDKGERILELVRDGILSVEEGLDLLENLSKEEAKKAQAKNQESKDSKTTSEERVDDTHSEKEEKKYQEAKENTEKEAQEKKRHEEELEAIANEINQFSAAIDRLNEDLLRVNKDLTIQEERLENKIIRQDQSFEKRTQELEERIIILNKEIKWLRSEDEEDPEQIEGLNQELATVLDDLYELENNQDDEAIEAIEKEIRALKEEREALAEEKDKMMKQMHSLKMKQWTNKAKQFSSTMDIPKDWREGANKTIEKAGEIIDESSQNLGGFLREAMKKTKDTLRDVDWKDINLDLGKKEKASFRHEWLFEETTASILDIQNTHGDIHFKKSMNDSIKVEAKVKLYEKKEGLSPLESFEEKAMIRIDSDQFSFNVSSKEIKADLVIYLPERNYDYVRVHSSKGDLTFDDLLAGDLYIKLTAGDLIFKELKATMLEVKMTKGDFTIKEADLKDLLLDTRAGDIRVIGQVESSDLNTLAGDILLTLSGEKLIQLSAQSVKGDVKVSLPKDLGFEIEAKTGLGSVKSRLSASEKSLEDEVETKVYRFFRMGDGKIGQIHLQTRKGNILLKDSSKKKGKGDTDEKTDKI